MSTLTFQDVAKQIVLDYVKKASDTDEVYYDNVAIVWFCKTLQNWKAIVTVLGTNNIFEVTYNGDKKEAYLDVYNKFENVVITDFRG